MLVTAQGISSLTLLISLGPLGVEYDELFQQGTDISQNFIQKPSSSRLQQNEFPKYMSCVKLCICRIFC